jgi:hypothetical protein
VRAREEELVWWVEGRGRAVVEAEAEGEALMAAEEEVGRGEVVEG